MEGGYYQGHKVRIDPNARYVIWLSKRILAKSYGATRVLNISDVFHRVWLSEFCRFT